MQYKNRKDGINALSLANWFVQKGIEDTEAPYKVTLLRLMKLVFLAYGYGLAVLDGCLIDPRFDKVEAWRYGSVIPSVYHSFKHWGNNQITDLTKVIVNENNGEPQFEKPVVNDDEVNKLISVLP